MAQRVHPPLQAFSRGVVPGLFAVVGLASGYPVPMAAFQKQKTVISDWFEAVNLR